MLTLDEAAQALGARRIRSEASFNMVSTDSRTVASAAPGALFVALRGERFDGHDYAIAAIAAGAAGAIIDARSGLAVNHPNAPLIEVEDTRVALGALARCWRGRFTIPVICVAGSNGKTTTKEMIAAILRAQFGAAQVLATEGNFNNDIGLPLTVLRLRETHRVAVIEIGMNHPGETAVLATIAQPTIALVNNAQREHQEFMKSVAEVAEEHAALFAALPAEGVAVINADDMFAALWRRIAGGRPIRDFGLSAPARVNGRAIDAPNDGSTGSGEYTALRIVLPEGEVSTRLHIPGEHNVRNALGAAAAASAAGASLAAIGQGLESFAPAKGRLQVKRGAQGAIVIDDTYNANPDSVRAAIDVLAERNETRVLVLGDMGEVGDEGPAYHEEIGRYARERGITRLLAIGEMTRRSVGVFGAGGAHFEDVAALLERARRYLSERPAILVKGSRFMRMERIVDGLTVERVERSNEERPACC